VKRRLITNPTALAVSHVFTGDYELTAGCLQFSDTNIFKDNMHIHAAMQLQGNMPL
jgi:hypothetical protein